jgi:hypothetical protein
MTKRDLLRVVRLTARSSALLFAAAQTAGAVGPRASKTSRALYLAFLTAHAVHFTAVTRYALLTGGRNLFPGGRSLNDVGGWRTVAGIFGTFAGLAVTGWLAQAGASSRRPGAAIAGRAATGVIAAMFVGTYLGKVAQSRWYALPAAAVATGTIARFAVPRAGRMVISSGPERDRRAVRVHGAAQLKAG